MKMNERKSHSCKQGFNLCIRKFVSVPPLRINNNNKSLLPSIGSKENLKSQTYANEDLDDIIIYDNSMVDKSIDRTRVIPTKVSNIKDRSIIVYNLPVTLLQLLLFFYFVTSVIGNCQYVAVNLAKYDQCIDNVCSYITSVDTNLQLLTGNEVCLDFEGLSNQYRLNITVDYAIQLKTLEYNYFSGDPLFDARGSCGCNNGFSSGDTCQNTCGEFNLNYMNQTSCKTYVHQSSKCALTPLGVESTWCRKYGLSTNNRLKINKYSDSSQIMIQLSLRWGNDTESIMLTGENKEIKLKKLPFVLTGYDLSINDLPAPTFTVIDKLHIQDFYMLPADRINSLNSYDMSKIGWIKYKRSPLTAQANLNQVSSQLVDCDKNTFRDIKPWFTTDQLLNNFKMYLSDTYNARTILIDPDFPTNHYVRQDHPVIANYLLDTGFIFTDLNGAMKSWGITIDRLPSIYPETNYYLDLLTNHGNKTGMFACDESPALDEYGTEIFLDFCIDSELNFGFFTYQWICNQSNCTEVNGKYFGSKFQVHLWPDRITTLVWNGTIIDENQNLGQELLIPYKLATTNLKLDFHGFNVTFVKTTINPEIRSLTSSGFHLYLEALSLSNEGNCFVSASPAALLIPISIYLKSQPSFYNISLSQVAFNGSSIIYLTCGPNIVHKNLTISYNNTPEYINWESEVHENETWAKKNVDLFGLFSKFKLLSVKARILSIILWIFIIITLIVLILIIIGTKAYMLPYYLIYIPIRFSYRSIKKVIPHKQLILETKVASYDYVYPKSLNTEVLNMISNEISETCKNQYIILLSLLATGKLKSPIKPDMNKDITFKDAVFFVPDCYTNNKKVALLQGLIVVYKCPCKHLVNNKLTIKDVASQNKLIPVVQELCENVKESGYLLSKENKSLAKILILPLECPLKGDQEFPLSMIPLAFLKTTYLNWGFYETSYGTDLINL